MKPEMQMRTCRGTFRQSRWFRRQRSIPFEEQRALDGTAAAEDRDKAVSQRLRRLHR